MKAILVTKENQHMLMGRYDLEDEVFMPIGYWLVTDFGEDNYDFSLLSEENFEAQFAILGDIENGFKSIEAL